MAAATVAQLLSISHEMTVRHFRCAEHGELTHVAAMVAGSTAIHAQQANDAFSTQESDAADAHEHCGVAFTVEGSSCAPTPISAIGAVEPPAPPAHPTSAVAILVGRVGVLASAPKTSPPSA